MPKLVRLYITHVAIGFGIAAVFVAVLLGFNVANLWHLVMGSDKGWLAVLILWLANGIVFAGVQFAIAVHRCRITLDLQGDLDLSLRRNRFDGQQVENMSELDEEWKGNQDDPRMYFPRRLKATGCSLVE